MDHNACLTDEERRYIEIGRREATSSVNEEELLEDLERWVIPEESVREARRRVTPLRPARPATVEMALHVIATKIVEATIDIVKKNRNKHIDSIIKTRLQWALYRIDEHDQNVGMQFGQLLFEALENNNNDSNDIAHIVLLRDFYYGDNDIYLKGVLLAAARQTNEHDRYVPCIDIMIQNGYTFQVKEIEKALLTIIEQGRFSSLCVVRRLLNTFIKSYGDVMAMFESIKLTAGASCPPGTDKKYLEMLLDTVSMDDFRTREALQNALREAREHDNKDNYIKHIIVRYSRYLDPNDLRGSVLRFVQNKNSGVLEVLISMRNLQDIFTAEFKRAVANKEWEKILDNF